MSLPKRIPGATYRLQLNRDFTFRQAIALVNYFRDLGITDCYLSPILQTTPRSTHGYDVCAFDQINPMLGTEADLREFSAALRIRGMGLLLDIVPNHMGADLANAWWRDVLENGRFSAFAEYFDIDWEPPHTIWRGQVLLPILEDHYSKVLEAGKLKLGLGAAGLVIKYYDKDLPLALFSYPVLLDQAARQLAKSANGQLNSIQQVKALLEAFSDLSNISPPEEAVPTARLARLKEEFLNVVQNDSVIRGALEAVIQTHSGSVGVPSSFASLHKLLEKQHYRLAYWRTGPDEINYRRFFDVADLVSLRMELPQVFHACHCFVFDLLKQGIVTGLRVDHPDGLANPATYFTRLQQQEAAYVVAEKILGSEERLPADWMIDGTTGYDFLNQVNGMFVRAEHQIALQKIYGEFTGLTHAFENVADLSKKEVIATSFVGDLKALGSRIHQLAAFTLAGRDLTLAQIEMALAEIIAAFPIYRTYIQDQSAGALERERNYLEAACRNARACKPRIEPLAFDFLQALLTVQPFSEFDAAQEALRLAVVTRFQQLTSAVMAKGVEDTAFYRYHRLISLNEVGGNPGEFGNGTENFHRQNLERAHEWPHSLLATSTHDTKRGEDARARINVISEIPTEWHDAVWRWRAFNADKKQVLNGKVAPDPNDEYLFYETLIGAWPEMSSLALEPEPDSSAAAAQTKMNPSARTLLFPESEFLERVVAQMTKSAREAKVNTSWTRQNQSYESAVEQFVRKVLEPSAGNLFLDDFRSLQRRVAFFGILNSLSQTLVKIAAPGVPDFYQGSELWDLNFVDPDNRRPIDFEHRRILLNKLTSEIDSANADLRQLVRRLLARPGDGEIKLYLIMRALELRNHQRVLFERGSYLPIPAIGSRREHVFAFARTSEDRVAIIAVPRLVCTLMGCEALPVGTAVWGGTELDISHLGMTKSFRNVFTGEEIVPTVLDNCVRVNLGQLFATAPMALLEGS
jgi:(1->4)-alpha-D-glucan 1-alpha-D-glucosylmutase